MLHLSFTKHGPTSPHLAESHISSLSEPRQQSVCVCVKLEWCYFLRGQRVTPHDLSVCSGCVCKAEAPPPADWTHRCLCVHCTFGTHTQATRNDLQLTSCGGFTTTTTTPRRLQNRVELLPGVFPKGTTISDGPASNAGLCLSLIGSGFGQRGARVQSPFACCAWLRPLLGMKIKHFATEV